MELLHGLEQSRIAPDGLSPHELALLPSPIVGELIDVTDLASSQVVAFRPSLARYEARVAAELQVMPQSSIQSFEITCQSLSIPISEIAVRFDKPLPDSAEWTLLGHPESVDSRRLPVPEQENAATNSSALYLLKLPYTATKDVRLSIRYSEPIQASMIWNSISFPQAEQWGGQVALRGRIRRGSRRAPRRRAPGSTRCCPPRPGRC